MTAVVAGPAGYLSVLAVLVLLITREFQDERRSAPAHRRYSVSSVLIYVAVPFAFAILAIRFIGFS